MPEDMPDRMPDRMPEDMSEYMPEDMPDRMPDRMPEDMSDRMPEDMPDRMPEDLPDRMPEDMPEDMPEHMPEDMPDRMPNRMPEDMSDRMPQDLPVRKCINVMVGITRSKVIWRSSTARELVKNPKAWGPGPLEFGNEDHDIVIFVTRSTGWNRIIGCVPHQTMIGALKLLRVTKRAQHAWLGQSWVRCGASDSKKHRHLTRHALVNWLFPFEQLGMISPWRLWMNLIIL